MANELLHHAQLRTSGEMILQNTLLEVVTPIREPYNCTASRTKMIPESLITLHADFGNI